MKTDTYVHNPSRKQKEQVMFRRHPACMGLILVVFVSFGCGHAPFSRTPLDKNWGKSFERAKVSQQVDPDASKNLDPVTGLDGQAAQADMTKYRKAHEAQKGGGGSGTPFLLGTLKGSTAQ